MAIDEGKIHGLLCLRFSLGETGFTFRKVILVELSGIFSGRKNRGLYFHRCFLLAFYTAFVFTLPDCFDESKFVQATQKVPLVEKWTLYCAMHYKFSDNMILNAFQNLWFEINLYIIQLF